MQHVTVLQFCWCHEIFFPSGPIWVSEKEGKSQRARYGMYISVLSYSHTTVVQKFLHWRSRASRSILVMHKPIYSAPLLRLFLHHIFLQILYNICTHTYIYIYIYIYVGSQLVPVQWLQDHNSMHIRERISMHFKLTWTWLVFLGSSKILCHIPNQPNHS